MKTPARLCIEKQLICRQYHEKWKFRDYNEIIKKLQCNHILSFNNCPIPGDFQDNNDVPVSTCKFSNKQKNISAIANENGIVCIENIKNVQAMKFIQTHKNTVYDIAWMPGSTQFVTVSGDNSAKLWDCQESNINLISTFMGHKRSVRCVSFKPENTSVFATGSRDGSLIIWDVRAWKKCAKFSHHLPDQVIPSGAGSSNTTLKKNSLSLELLNSRSVTGLVFQNDNTLISCGSMDKFIRVWDMRKTYSRSSTNTVAKFQFESPNVGFSYLCMNALGTKLYANCMDSYIYCFNSNSYDPDPVAAFYGHTNGSFYVKSSVSFDGSYLMSGSSDEAAYIWNTRNAELSLNAVKPFIVLNAHSAEVTCVEMCPDNMMVVTCSDDGTFRLWDPYMLKQQRDEKVDTAAYYDDESVPAVKSHWKNKRKFKELEEIDSESEKILNCSSHTKICRFYNINHSSPCICQSKFTSGKREKRVNDDVLQENEFARKRIAPEKRECTSFKNNKFTYVVSKNHEEKIPQKLQLVKSLKVPSKRKLDDASDFKDDCTKTKKINSGRLLTPLSLLEIDQNTTTHLKISEELQKKPLNNSTNELHKKISSDKSNESMSCLTALPSPTSNLPNYVEDGTSPYIHKCPRVMQKENDWLTKLRQTYKPKILDPKPLSPNSTSPHLEKRKKAKLVDYTLHKYFKISSKGLEKSFNVPEIQKRNILAKVDT